MAMYAMMLVCMDHVSCVLVLLEDQTVFTSLSFDSEQKTLYLLNVFKNAVGLRYGG